MRSLIPACYYAILNLIFPPFCQFCEQALSTGQVFCVPCSSLIRPVASYKLSCTTNKDLWVHAIGAYEGPLKNLILSKKWKYAIASKQLGTLLWYEGGASALSFDIIVPVPLHWKRFYQRGYNQASIMAQELSFVSGKPLVEALNRVRATKFQSSLDKHERIRNVEKSFNIKSAFKPMLAGKRILLVDDLLTTGATMQQAAKVLFAARPKNIIGLVGARVP